MDYQEFLQRKTQVGCESGFEPIFMPECLFDFQKHLVEWAVRKGRAAIFADCGMGKTLMQLAWAENVHRKTNRPVLILTPLAVSAQTCEEAKRFGIDASVSRDGKVMPEITVTNYERLHYFNADDFDGVVCDESSILKNYAGKTRDAITAFISKTPYRLLCTATPAPNDYMELGTSAEALSVLRRVEMLSQYFVHDSGDTQQWRIKGHAKNPFWRFVASWARALRNPSDIGFNDDRFVLPSIEYKQHTIKSEPQDGRLFVIDANTLDDQRKARRSTMQERCEMVASIANENDEPFIAWCDLNDESVIMSKMIRGAVEITGSMDDDDKAEKMLAFANGQIRAIVSKPRIAGFGMNFQVCHQMSFFPSHSYEQFYQAVRRCWRFGQKHDVCVHIVTSEAEKSVLDNMQKKERESDAMFSNLLQHMKDFYSVEKKTYTANQKMEIPTWIA